MDERVEREMEQQKSRLPRTCMAKNADKPKCASTPRNIYCPSDPQLEFSFHLFTLRTLYLLTGCLGFQLLAALHQVKKC